MDQSQDESRSAPGTRFLSLTFSPGKLIIVCLVYLAGMAAAEYINLYLSAAVGISLYLLILFSLMIWGALTKDSAQRGLWLALGLAPLIRIISLAMPVTLTISQYIWYIIISIPIIAALVTVSRALKFNPDNIGLNFNQPVEQALIGLSGAVLAAFGYFLLKPAAWTTALTVQSTLFPALVLLIFTGFIEELAFRGVMQRTANAIGSYGWIYVAAVYAVFQIQQGSWLYCLAAMAVGLYFGYVVKRTGSIIGVGLAHGLFNIGLYLILPHLFQG